MSIKCFDLIICSYKKFYWRHDYISKWSGIPLPPPEEKEATPPPAEEEDEVGELDIEAVIEETEKIVEENLVEEMDQGKIAEQLMMSVQNMVGE